MIATLHSGEFLDYEGNIIRVTFKTDVDFVVSIDTITCGGSGGVYEVTAYVTHSKYTIGHRITSYDWSKIELIDKYINSDNHNVYKYKITVNAVPEGAVLFNPRIGFAIFETDIEGKTYQKTIKITQQ